MPHLIRVDLLKAEAGSAQIERGKTKIWLADDTEIEPDEARKLVST